MTATNEVFGRPIVGDIPRYTEGRYVEQRPSEEFMEALDTFLAVPGVKSIGWEQYTPYFNDGEACVFSAGDPAVELDGVAGDDDAMYHSDFSDDDDEDDETLKFRSIWSLTSSYRADEVKAELLAAGFDPEVIIGEAEKFSKVFNSGAYDVFLNQTFGDPATVRATTKGFQVETFDHD